jgi:transposase
VQTGLGVSGDGGVPVFHRAYDGGAGEVAQVAGAMRALRQLAGKRGFLLVGDSKLVSYANLRDIMAAGVDFIAPASKTYVPAEVLAALDPAMATRWTTWPNATRASHPSSGAATAWWRTP